MSDKPILFKKDREKDRILKPGRTYRLMIKSEHLEAIIAEIDPHTSSQWFKHTGEELHYVLEGKIEYIVGDKSYKLKEGELLWHKANVKHKAVNNTDKIAKYATVGTPPTFTINEEK